MSNKISTTTQNISSGYIATKNCLLQANLVCVDATTWSMLLINNVQRAGYINTSGAVFITCRLNIGDIVTTSGNVELKIQDYL